jgi:SAM-dependent methyltransferase
MALPLMKRLSHCVACGSPGWSVTEVRQGYELAVCSDCGLLFTVNPDYKTERYLAGYEGKAGEAALPDEYAFVYEGPQLRLELEGRAYFCPRPRLTASERLALRWLKAHVPPAAVVVECGCGTGRFLRALKRARLQGAGVELSAVTVGLLNRAGLIARQGAAPDFPWESPDPFALAFFEVLEHLAEPRPVIEGLKQRFPRAVIIGSVPCPKRWPPGSGGAADSPPHHYLLWTPTALEKFFRSLGYRKVTVQLPKPVGYEQRASCGMVLSRFGRFRARPSPPNAGSGVTNKTPPPNSNQRSLTATCKIWLLAAYHLWINILGTPQARRAGQKGFSAASMLFIAEP